MNLRVGKARRHQSGRGTVSQVYLLRAETEQGHLECSHQRRYIKNIFSKDTNVVQMMSRSRE